jgi:hypothetical protein
MRRLEQRGKLGIAPRQVGPLVLRPGWKRLDERVAPDGLVDLGVAAAPAGAKSNEFGHVLADLEEGPQDAGHPPEAAVLGDEGDVVDGVGNAHAGLDGGSSGRRGRGVTGIIAPHA